MDPSYISSSSSSSSSSTSSSSSSCCSSSSSLPHALGLHLSCISLHTDSSPPQTFTVLGATSNPTIHNLFFFFFFFFLFFAADSWTHHAISSSSSSSSFFLLLLLLFTPHMHFPHVSNLQELHPQA
jgi:hypothetical protein